MGSLILTSAMLQLETRRKTALKHRLNRVAPLDGVYDEDRHYDLRFPLAQRRPVGPANTYNCHGLTFGSRRAEVSYDDVPLILEQDDSTEVGRDQVLAGDVVVYFSTKEFVGEPEHSGVVVEPPDQLKNIKIVSKWGYGDERVHFLADCPYDPTDVRFFRINDCPRSGTRRPFQRSARPGGSQLTIISP